MSRRKTGAEWVDEGPRSTHPGRMDGFTHWLPGSVIAERRDREEKSTYGMGRDSIATHGSGSVRR